MNILVVHDKPLRDAGGMSRFIAAQRELLRGAGHGIITVVCAPGAGADEYEAPSTGRRTGRAAYATFEKLIARHEPDVIQIHSGYYALGPLLLERLAALSPVVYVLHDVTPLCPRSTKITQHGELCDRAQGANCVLSGCYAPSRSARPLSDAYGLFMRAWQVRTYRKLPAWIVPSRYLAGELRRVGVADDRITVVPHFVSALRRPSPVPCAPRILYAGRLIEEKGLRVLVEAMARLASGHWSLRIAGDGPLAPWLAQEISRRGWTDRVQMLSTLTPEVLEEEYERARIVVMPSLIPESFGLVGLEAASHARPVAGFVSGGMAEWLRDGVSGLAARWGSAASLATQIDRLLADHALCTDLGLGGWRMAKAEFAPHVHLARIESVFRRQCAYRIEACPA